MSWRVWLIWLLKSNLIVWIINISILALLVFSGSNFNDLVFSGYFSKITLLETGIALLIGGALAFSGSVLSSKAREHILKSDENWSMEKLRKTEKRANKYIVFALFLFFESIIISFLIA